MGHFNMVHRPTWSPMWNRLWLLVDRLHFATDSKAGGRYARRESAAYGCRESALVDTIFQFLAAITYSVRSADAFCVNLHARRSNSLSSDYQLRLRRSMTRERIYSPENSARGRHRQITTASGRAAGHRHTGWSDLVGRAKSHRGPVVRLLQSRRASVVSARLASSTAATA